jgi:Protein of unknown function (DUF2587)
MSDLSQPTPAGTSTGAASDAGPPTPRIVVVGADGRAASEVPPQQPDDRPEDVGSLVDQPTKVMRIGTMIKQLLDEVRSAPLDEAARSRLAEVHARSVRELEDGLSPELVDELRRITLPLDESDPPSDAELRIAHAQLVGWLEGLFHGIQTALVAQRMASQAQLAQMRHALPPGVMAGQPPNDPGAPPQAPDGRPTPGQYL